jgi:pseudouridine kinase
MHITVIGGSNIDMIAVPKSQLKQGDSNPGTHTISFGGVGRNIAYNLAMLRHHVTFYTTLSQDSLGLAMQQDAKEVMNLYGVHTKQSNYYIAVMEPKGDLFVAVASMDSMSELKVEDLSKHEVTILKSDMIILETNVDVSIIDYVSKLDHPCKIIELVSTTKASKAIQYKQYFHYIKGNKQEIQTLFETSHPKDVQATLWKGQTIIMTNKDQDIYHIKHDVIETFKPPQTHVTHTSGAGDAFLSGYIDGIHHKPLQRGFDIAAKVLASTSSTLKEPL